MQHETTTFNGGALPGRKRCLELLTQEGVPPHIQEHSMRVAEVAMKLAEAINRLGGALDMELVEAGALLHDISKFHTIENGGNHCVIGGERARELGLDAIAPIIERHVDIGEWDPEGPVTEAELINYADKRVRHNEIVTLDERFEDLLERYGITGAAQERITAHWQTVKRLQDKVMSRVAEGERF